MGGSFDPQLSDLLVLNGLSGNDIAQMATLLSSFCRYLVIVYIFCAASHAPHSRNRPAVSTQLICAIVPAISVNLPSIWTLKLIYFILFMCFWITSVIILTEIPAHLKNTQVLFVLQ